MGRINILIFAICISFAFVLAVEIASAFGTASFSTYQAPPASFSSYYSRSDLEMLWPSLADPATCKARQDILLQVAPFGCQPMVVRSDLLAEQNVPVLCQIMAVQLNPGIDVKNIRNIRFKGNYPKEVSGVGFHPAKAALRTRNELTGSPFINNIGYVVVILKRNPKEAELPKFVNVTLTAQVDYTADNALGIGKAYFVLEEQSDSQWEEEKYKQSFWDGRYSVRLITADDNFATIALYHNQQRISTIRVDKNKPAREVYLPGTYCQIALQVYYDGFVAADTRAVIEVSDGAGVDELVLYKGSRFLNDKCYVRDIRVENTSVGGFGSAEIVCGGERFTLSKTPRAFVYSEGQEVLAKVKTNNGVETTNAKITRVLEEGMYEISYTSGDKTASAKVSYSDLSPRISERGQAEFLQDIEIKDANAKERLLRALEAYNKVADDYPFEKPKEESGVIYGERALREAIELAGELEQFRTEYELKSKYLDMYPGGQKAFEYQSELKQSYNIDSSGAVRNIIIDNRDRTIRLLDVQEPSKKPSFEGILGTSSVKAIAGEREDFAGGNFVVEEIRAEQVKISSFCTAKDGKEEREFSGIWIRVGESQVLCKSIPLKITRTETEKLASIRIVPEARGTEIETNISVNIGIEKRAIKLSTDRKKDMIESLNKSIEKWESISERLGKVVKTLKSACLATSTLLTFKNFISGLSGETIARQEVMNGENGWKAICKKEVAEGKYKTQSGCYNAHSEEINADIEATKKAIEKVDTEIKQSEKGLTTSAGGISGILGEKSVKTEEAKKRLAGKIREQYGNEKISLPEGKTWMNDGKTRSVNVSALLAEDNLDSMTYAEMRNIYMNLERRKATGLSAQQRTNTGSILGTNADRISDKIYMTNQYAETKKLATHGLPDTVQLTQGVNRIYADVVDTRSLGGIVTSDNLAEEDVPISTNVASVFVPQKGDIKGGQYLLGLKEDPNRQGNYIVENVYYNDGTTSEPRYIALSENEKNKFISAYNVGFVTSKKSVSYNNKITNAQVRYYETEPYKGMPAIVPFDVSNGWYAATRQTLPAFGGIGAFDASGRVTSFWVCNVDGNGRIEFDEGFGDDICQMVNLQTGQPLGAFYGLSEEQSKRIVQEAIDAITQAQRQYGNRIVTINRERFEVGTPMANIPETQCEDFMSIGDCNLLFNVCDPVICPPSRCNFGGTYNVPDVIQSGIAGSILLCLPNFGPPNEGGVLIPLCLTGIQAGIDAYVSLLKNHRDCLQESIDKGTMSGICDQIYSVYLCEFFWRQVGPFLNNLIPKLFEIMMQKNVPRGGGEYATVAAAWQNAENSFKYFTQTYSVNSFKAFQVGSITEVGSEVCRAYISASGPKKLDSLIEPDSPPQYEAWFDAIPYSSATVPATSQYKVFYHIFAGKSAQGVYYSVYLRSPPESTYYSYNPTIYVASGFIKQGEYASQTKDFTAPEGYKDLCININGDEKCNFKQVSTNFAVNYLRDRYVQERIETTGITTEAGCISGSVGEASIGALVANTNPLSAGQEALLPADYNRGIVRICSTNNPGSSTDPTRFKEVGICGDQKIKCWLDTQSVNNAITYYAAGTKNETLQNLEANVNQAGVQVTTEMIDSEIASNFGNYMTYDEVKKFVEKSDAAKIAEALGRIDVMMDTAILNRQKAQLLYIKARILGEVAKKACKDVKCVNGEKMKAEGAAAGAATKEGGVQYFFNTAGEQAWVFYNGQGYVFDSEKLEWREGNALISDTKHSWWVPKAENVVNPEFPFVPNKFFVYTLSENYNPLKIIKIQKNGEDTRIWMFESKIYYGYSLTYEDLQIGTITNNKINLLPGAEKNGNVKEYYSDLNGASISGTAITPAAA